MYNPLVSIIIPVYNGTNYLTRAIESALSQSYPNIEILVINDGSDDDGGTERLVLSYGNRVRYLSKPNGGVATALNLGIKSMRGDYFSWLSHDDEYTPDKIQNQIDSLRENDFDNWIISLCGATYIDENSTIRRTLVKRKKNFEDKIIYSGDEIVLEMLKYSVFGGCAFLIPRVAFDRIGLFNETYKFAQDLMMWYKMFLSGYSMKYTANLGVLSRIHSEQLTQRGQKLFLKEFISMSNELIPLFTKESTEKYNFIGEYAKIAARYRQREIVKKSVKNNKHLFPLSSKIAISILLFYSIFRPTIRRIYHLIFNNVRTSALSQ